MNIDRLEALEGKTIKIARKVKLADIRLLQFGFTDGTECTIVADNPTLDVNLVDDSEHIIPAIEKQLTLGTLEGTQIVSLCNMTTLRKILKWTAWTMLIVIMLGIAAATEMLWLLLFGGS